jgi:tetratricopeptide (TPR) repeat protein
MIKHCIFFEKVGDPIGQADVYLSKGDIYLITGENSKAIDMCDRALKLYEISGSDHGKANVYSSKSQIYYYMNDYLNASEMNNKALKIYEKKQDIRGQGHGYHGKGIIYLDTGNNIKASEMFDKALYFYEKSGDIIGQANVYRGKGLVYFNIGKNSKSLEMYEKAYYFYDKAGNLLGKGNTCCMMGDFYFNTGNQSKAFEMYGKALTFLENSGDLWGQGNAYRGMWGVYFNTGDYSKALEVLDKALFFFEKVGHIESVCNVLIYKAKMLVSQRKKNEAYELFKKGIEKLEKMRTKTTSSDMKKSLMERVYGQYRDTVLFMLENKFIEKGFKYAESMRARVFMEQMAEGSVPLKKGLKPQLKEERDNLVGKLSALSRQMQETPGNEEKKLQELKEEYCRVEAQFEDVLIKIRLENPLYSSVHYPQPVSVHDLQTDVLKNDETLLSYFIAPGKAYAFIVTKENFQVKPLPVNEKDIDGYVQRFLLAIKENHSNEMNRLDSLIYEKLFQPLEKYLKKTREIVIVPSGSLETIPFESLIVSKKNPERPVYLLEKYRLKYVQGASLLSILRRHYTSTFNTGANTAKSFIGFGDPVYDYQNFKQCKPEQGSIFSHEDTRSDTEKKVEVKAEVEKGAPSGHLFNASGETLEESTEEILLRARVPCPVVAPFGQIFNCLLSIINCRSLIFNSESWQSLNPINLVQTIVFHQSPLTIPSFTTHHSPTLLRMKSRKSTAIAMHGLAASWTACLTAAKKSKPSPTSLKKNL